MIGGLAIRKMLLATVVFFGSLSHSASALDYAAGFKNCSQMRATYRLGVAINAKISGEYPAVINKRIYSANSFLDKDSDGIVCENEILQIKLNLSAGSPSTTTTPPTLPTPQSPQSLTFQNGGSANLVKGVTYIIKACGVKPWPTYLDVLSLTNGWTQKATATWGIDTSFCQKSFPYLVSFGWKVIENPGEVTSIQLRGFTNEMKMKVVITDAPVVVSTTAPAIASSLSIDHAQLRISGTGLLYIDSRVRIYGSTIQKLCVNLTLDMKEYSGWTNYYAHWIRNEGNCFSYLGQFFPINPIRLDLIDPSGNQDWSLSLTVTDSLGRTATDQLLFNR